MARAFAQSQTEYGRDPQDWQSLRGELAALLEQVDSQVARTRPEMPISERMRDLRFQTEQDDESRRRDALKSVQRQISRFEDPTPQPTPSPRDSLQAAINQIRSRQGEAPRPPVRIPSAPAPAHMPAPVGLDPQMLERLADAVSGISGRLERLEGDIKTQLKSGANVKDVAEQVSQLAHVVELLAGAVGETGQVKRLEGQIASLGKIMSQGREMDISTLTRRLDDVAATVGKLAELQVHFADKVQNPVESQAFNDGMSSIAASVSIVNDSMSAIESSVRAVYDRIDSLERQRSISPDQLDHLTAEMARFTESMRQGTNEPLHLVELVDALNVRISDIESGDRLLHGLRKDLSALRDAVVVTLSPRFDAIEERIGTLSTRDDLAEIGRQIGALGDRIGDRPIDNGMGQLEAQVRQLVARMDQTGEQLSGLAKLYSAEPANVAMPDIDFSGVADMVATRAAEAVQKAAPNTGAITATIVNLEQRIGAMLRDMRRDPEIDSLDGMQAGIAEVNDRLKRLESSLLERTVVARAPEPVPEPARKPDIASIIETAERSLAAARVPAAEAPVLPAQTQPPAAPAPRARDAMPRNPGEDAPLIAPAFPNPGPLSDALESKSGSRKLHPGLDAGLSLAARHDVQVPSPAAPPNFVPEAIPTPPAPRPSAGFFDSEPMVSTESSPAPAPVGDPVSSSTRNTFIEAARRAAQRQQQQPGNVAPVPTNSLIGRALARFQTGAAEPTAELPIAPKAKPEKPEKPLKAEKSKPEKIKPERAIRALAGDKPARTEFKPEPVVSATPSIEPQIAVDGPKVKAEGGESFLLKNRKVILLAAAIVALGFLTINLIAQKLTQESEPAAAAPITTGDISDDAVAPAGVLPSDASLVPGGKTPRIIPLEDPAATGSIDSSAVNAFTTTPLQTMPSAFAAATEMAAADPAATAPLGTEMSPLKFDLPPDNVGPIELRQAAADGDARAQFEIGAIYTEGRAVPQDYALAATWYERAAAQGFAPAQYRLGSLYESGSGVEKDPNSARLWYERAAEAGNRMSMHNLAALYAGGLLGKQQFDSAAKWFEEAAGRGLTDSQFNLGMLYARGLGVTQSLEASYKWFGIAALSGDKDAAKARDDMARSLDADTLSRLQAEIAAFKPAPIDLAANFAPIGTWTKTFDPGETITSKDIVASVQKALGKLGYDVGVPDGIAGSKTATAIRDFEQSTGMTQVGQINPRLLAVLGSQPV